MHEYYAKNLILSCVTVGLTALGACSPTENVSTDTGSTKTVPITASTSCKIDMDARIPWAEWNREDDALSTAVFEYSGCGKRLVFIASEHGNDPESATYLAVIDAVSVGPSIALIEGVPASRGENFAPMLDYASSVGGTLGDSEAMLTARLAFDAGIPVIGAEPDDTDVLSHAQNHGVRATELIGFYILRQLPQMINAEEVDGATDPRMAEVIKDLVPYFANEVGLTAEAVANIDTLPEFTRWYEAFNGVPFETGFGFQDVSPSSNVDDVRETNRVSDIVADARDTFILQQIQNALDQHDHVLIVYGGSHQTVQNPALQAAFGPPVRLR